MMQFLLFYCLFSYSKQETELWKINKWMVHKHSSVTRKNCINLPRNDPFTISFWSTVDANVTQTFFRKIKKASRHKVQSICFSSSMYPVLNIQKYDMYSKMYWKLSIVDHYQFKFCDAHAKKTITLNFAEPLRKSPTIKTPVFFQNI